MRSRDANAPTAPHAGRTDPILWEKAKATAIRRLDGRHSARAMQLAGHIYRAWGGGYIGAKTATQKRLTRWTAEDWTTADGAPARRHVDGRIVYDRYLPRVAWKALTPAERAATRRKKRSARGQQYVPNTRRAREEGARARRQRR